MSCLNFELLFSYQLNWNPSPLVKSFQFLFSSNLAITISPTPLLPSIHPPIHPSICPLIHPSTSHSPTHQSIQLFSHVFSFRPSVLPFLLLTLFLSFPSSNSPFIHPLSVTPLSLPPSIQPCIHLCFPPSSLPLPNSLPIRISFFLFTCLSTLQS